MRYLFLVFIFWCNLASSQVCSVDTIGIKVCEFDIIEHVIPVHVGYTGTPDTVLIEATGLDYSFEPQYFRMFQHFINPSNINTFHFPIYNVDNSIDSIDVKVTLIGNTCNAASHFLMKTLIVDDPICFCNDFFVLSGTLNESKNYYAASYITSSQEILTGNNVLYSVKTYVDWGDGFQVDDGAILDINFIGCDL
jgi:hypothetical protein